MSCDVSVPHSVLVRVFNEMRSIVSFHNLLEDIISGKIELHSIQAIDAVSAAISLAAARVDTHQIVWDAGAGNQVRRRLQEQRVLLLIKDGAAKTIPSMRDVSRGQHRPIDPYEIVHPVDPECPDPNPQSGQRPLTPEEINNFQ